MGMIPKVDRLEEQLQDLREAVLLYTKPWPLNPTEEEQATMAKDTARFNELQAKLHNTK